MSGYYLDQLGKLVGGKIVGVAKDDSGDEDFYGLIVEKGKKKRAIFFLRDDEGNGPGSFEIQEV